MFATPQLGHLTANDYDHVYEPAEDSFILLDALEIEYDQIKASRPLICLEIGCGSGVVSTFISQILEREPVVLATDINPIACATTLKTCKINNCSVDTINCDLSGPLSERLVGKVDLIVFNPPYVPTTMVELSDTQQEHGIGGAWAGGAEGLEITSRLLPMIPNLLSPQGRFYLVAIAQNKPDDLMAQLDALGLSSHLALQRRAGRELLSVLSATKAMHKV